MRRDTARIAGTALLSAPRQIPPMPGDTDDLPRMPLAVRDVLGPELLATARQALDAAGITSEDARELGCVTASHRATAATATYIAEVLDGPGPRWLAPECFLDYSPHSLTGRLCIELGLDGTAITLTGPAGGVDALGYAAGMIASGRCARVLVATAHWPLPEVPGDTTPTTLSTAAVVLSADGGWGTITDWRPGGGHPAVRPRNDAGDEGGTGAPFAALADWYARRPSNGIELYGGGSRVALVPGAGA
ncbi:beta-ketoacyl synthase N-terminal-like domain-containing protein [Streptomyces sp. NPDC059255]|uniref:beta-ketoacyl synthase N-terminal-like domain-containing protein n=1 Tax=Streptomyces sp. NPDC059255 TaxID=3346793 RepID=UPI003697CA7B